MNIKNLIRLTAFLLIMASCFFSCKKDTPLKDTKWKLVGIMDVQTGALKELEPKDCEECYTLTFNTENTATALSIWAIYNINLTNLDLALDICTPDNMAPGPCLYEESKDGVSYEDSYMFRAGIVYSSSYEYISNEFKLFFSHLEKKYYLLFKPFESIEL